MKKYLRVVRSALCVVCLGFIGTVGVSSATPKIIGPDTSPRCNISQKTLDCIKYYDRNLDEKEDTELKSDCSRTVMVNGQSEYLVCKGIDCVHPYLGASSFTWIARRPPQEWLGACAMEQLWGPSNCDLRAAQLIGKTLEPDREWPISCTPSTMEECNNFRRYITSMGESVEQIEDLGLANENGELDLEKCSRFLDAIDRGFSRQIFPNVCQQ